MIITLNKQVELLKLEAVILRSEIKAKGRHLRRQILINRLLLGVISIGAGLGTATLILS